MSPWIRRGVCVDSGVSVRSHCGADQTNPDHAIPYQSRPRPHWGSTLMPPIRHPNLIQAPPRPHPDPTQTPPRPHTYPTQTPRRVHADSTQTPPRLDPDSAQTPHALHTGSTQTPRRLYTDYPTRHIFHTDARSELFRPYPSRSVSPQPFQAATECVWSH